MGVVHHWLVGRLGRLLRLGLGQLGRGQLGWLGQLGRGQLGRLQRLVAGLNSCLHILDNIAIKLVKNPPSAAKDPEAQLGLFPLQCPIPPLVVHL